LFLSICQTGSMFFIGRGKHFTKGSIDFIPLSSPPPQDCVVLWPWFLLWILSPLILGQLVISVKHGIVRRYAFVGNTAVQYWRMSPLSLPCSAEYFVITPKFMSLPGDSVSTSWGW
jgi:hypothetical protein